MRYDGAFCKIRWSFLPLMLVISLPPLAADEEWPPSPPLAELQETLIPKAGLDRSPVHHPRSLL